MGVCEGTILCVWFIEAKGSSIGAAFKQCMLSMRYLCEIVTVQATTCSYGFCTTGENGQMLRYDG